MRRHSCSRLSGGKPTGRCQKRLPGILYAQSERYRRLSAPLAEITRDLNGEHRDIMSVRPDTVIHLGSGAWHSAVFETDTVLLEVNLPPASQSGS